MKQAVVLAPCKVNLTLDITRRRSDGYHEMEMILLAADLCDRVTVTLHSGRGIRVECDDQMVPLDEGNLAVRAARIFYQRTGLPATGDGYRHRKTDPYGGGPRRGERRRGRSSGGPQRPVWHWAPLGGTGGDGTPLGGGRALLPAGRGGHRPGNWGGISDSPGAARLLFGHRKTLGRGLHRRGFPPGR